MYLKDNSTTKYYFTVFKNCEMNKLLEFKNTGLLDMYSYKG